MLNFNGLSWPHVTVGTLKKNVPVVIPPWKIDPDLPISELKRFHPPLPPEGAPVRTLAPTAFRPVPVPNPTPAPFAPHLSIVPVSWDLRIGSLRY
jgi:hypothetical protein